MNILKRLNISYLEMRAYFRFAKEVKTSLRFYNNINTSEIPDVSALSIKRTLKTLGINFTDGFTCLITSCPVCKKKVNIEKPKIFINKTTGYFLCNGCKLSGQWDLLEKCLSLKKDSKSAKEITSLTEKLIPKEEPDHLWIKILETTDSLIDISDSDFPELLSTFNFANIQKMFMSNLEARIDKSRKNMYFPLYGIDGKIHGYKVINSETNEEKTVPPQGCGGLMISKPTRATSRDTTATLVASVIDFLILSQSKLSCSAVCLPYGINSLPQSLLPSLEMFNKLVLWFGNESCSWDSVKHFSKKLGEKRCLFVRPIDKQLLPRLVRDDKEMKSIISSAQPVWHKSITTFASLRQDVFCDLQNIEKVQGVKWKRYPTLNKILKGHRRGELTILTGPTGCGKTTFMSEYSLDLAMQGVNTLWGSFEIRNARLARTMLQQFAGIPLELNLNQFDHWADEFERLPIYFMTFHGQQSVKVVMEAVEHAQYIHDISHVIIDNVQFMMGMTEEPKHMDRFWKQDVIIAAFRTFATRKNCHVTLVIHPRKERDTEDLTTSSIFGGAKASQEADNVLLIQDKRLTSVRGKKYLQVAKNRYSGDLGIMALDFEKLGLSYEQKRRKTVDEKDESLECK